MSSLSSEAIAAVDRDGLLGDVLEQPAHLVDALWRVESADIAPRDKPGGLLVCGMGGSAIGGDLARAALGARAVRPVRTVRGYELEPWVGPETVVLCSSYSGDTEETLACFEAAGAAGADRVVLTTGGALAAAARDAGVPVIGVPSGMVPRAAVAYMIVGVLECAALCGAAPALRSEIDVTAAHLRELTVEWGPEASDDSAGKGLAARLAGTVPVIYGAGPTEAPSRRWKTQFNENGKWPAFFTGLPEGNHNEICGWSRTKELAPLSAVFLEDADQHPRVRRRIELTAAAAADGAARVERVESRGETALERVMSLVLLGDLVSLYAAVLDGTDPTPIEPIESFKAELG